MSASFQPRGVWPAMVTPFADGQVDEAQYQRLLSFVVDQGVHGLVPCGTTGETPTLNQQEQRKLVDLCLKAASDKTGVLVGTGSNDTHKAIEATKWAKERGVSAALVVDCYYNGPSSLELRTEYYQRILDAVPDIPIVPYVIPGRTGCALRSEDLAMLHLSGRVPAVKQATGDLEWMKRDRSLAGPGLAILSGDDEKTLPMMLDSDIQSPGVVSVMANLVPGTVVRMVEAAARGQADEARAIAETVAPLFSRVGVSVPGVRQLPDGRQLTVQDTFRNPLPLKTMMAGLGMLEPGCRPPLGRMSQPGVDDCRSAVRQVWERSPDALRPIEDHFAVSIEERLGLDSAWQGS